MRKKKLWRSIVSGALATLMIASLTACGGAAAPATSGDASADAGATEASADGKETIVVITWGGDLEVALQKAAAGFEEANNCQISWQSAPDYSKIKAMVDNGDVQWDVCTVDADFAFRGGEAGLLEEIDYDVVPKEGIDTNCSTYGVPAYAWANVISFNSDLYDSTTCPQSWSDFWDVDTYPGARTFFKSPINTLEIALAADGVSPEEMYPLDLDRAFASLDKIKGNVDTWWESGAQPAQMLSSGQIDLADAWAGRVYSAKQEGAAVDYIMNEAIVNTDQWIVPKGTKHKDLVMKFLAHMTSPEAGVILSENIPYGPANQKAYDMLAPEIVDTLPSASKYEDIVYRLDSSYWAENYDAVNERFEAWLLE